MAIDFPASPSNGQTFTSGTVTYTYDGTKWTAVTGSVVLDKIEEGNTTAEVIDTGADGRFVVTTEGAERLRIDSSGRVGIGTASITGFSDYTTVQLGSSSSGAAMRLVANGDTPGTDDFVIYKNPSGSYLRSYGDPLVFYGNSSEYGRWDTSGRLLVGTSSSIASTSRLQVAGGDLSLYHAASGATAGYSIYFATDTGATARVKSGITNSDTSGAGGTLVFSTTADGASGPTERMRLTSTGQLRLAGAGITFNGDTAAANELDDYEEGTWTPVFNATGATFSTLSNVARYTKIGNVVRLSGYCQIYCSAGGGTNAVTVTGLPFATANISNMYQGGMLGNPNYFNATGYGLTGFIFPNATTVTLNKFTDVGGSKRTEALNSADITNANFSFLWTFVYQAA